MKNIEKSTYTSASGNLVTLYKNIVTGEMFTVVGDSITLYGRDGDMLCGAASIEAAIGIIGGAK